MIEMKKDNVVAGFHISGRNNDGSVKVNNNKRYNWTIPKFLREAPIKKGDIILAQSLETNCAILVAEVFREEFEETQRKYKRVIKVLERAAE